jgi:predicted nuclease of predicted toxin-antitoxin system
MRLYLDDDLASSLLAKLLRKERHDVLLPVDVGASGKPDPIHLTHAIREDRVCVSGDHGDYVNLHHLIRTAQGHHPGIFVVRRDNDPKRDLTPPGIVRAIRNLLAANLPFHDEVFVLNQWR